MELKINVPIGYTISPKSTTTNIILEKFNAMNFFRDVPINSFVKYTSSDGAEMICLVHGTCDTGVLCHFVYCIRKDDFVSPIMRMCMADAVTVKYSDFLSAAIVPEDNEDVIKMLQKLNEYQFKWTPGCDGGISSTMPNSFEEYVAAHPNVGDGERCVLFDGRVTEPVYGMKRSIGNAVYKNEKMAKAFIALRKLIYLRDEYNGDWRPNWCDTSAKYCIVLSRNNIACIKQWEEQRTLAFKDSLTMHMFLHNFNELIREAMPIL